MSKPIGKSVRYKIAASLICLLFVCVAVLLSINYFSSSEQVLRAVNSQLRSGSLLTSQKLITSNFGDTNNPWKVDINGTFKLHKGDIEELYQPYPFKQCSDTSSTLCQYANWGNYEASNKLFINHAATNTDNQTYCAQISLDREIRGAPSDFHSICVNLTSNTVWYRYYVP